MIDQLRAAAEALNQGDPEPFEALVPDVYEWFGVSHVHLLWIRTPACPGPYEAREIFPFPISKPGEPRMEVRPEFTQVGDDKIIGSTQWLGANGRRHERFQVLTLRDAKIVDMQGCASRRQAERFARHH